MLSLRKIRRWVTRSFLSTDASKFIDQDVSSGEEEALLGNDRDARSSRFDLSLENPAFYTISPLQRWLTPVMEKVRETGSFEVEDLPSLSADAAYLRTFLEPLLHKNVWKFVTQKEIGRRILLSAALEVSYFPEI